MATTIGPGINPPCSPAETGHRPLGFGLFTLLAGCSVLIPVIAYAVAAGRMRGPLERLKQWLQANNSTVIAVVLLVIGVVLLGKGLGGLL